MYNQIDQENKLIQKALDGFHGQRINAQYYDATKVSLSDKKPALSLKQDLLYSSQAIADYLLFRKEEINKRLGKEVINEENLYSEPKHQPENSLGPNPLENYSREITAKLERDYLPAGSKPGNLSEEKIKEAFEKGVSSDEFVKEYASEFKLTPAVKRGVKIQ